MGWSEGELSLTFLGDGAMARLNRETFGRRGPTNVIAFPLDAASGRDDAPTAPPHAAGPPPAEARRGTARRALTAATPPGAPGPPPLLGEVVISVESTIRQAKEFGWPWQELLDFFLIHGILHLMGYDHEDPDDENRMTARTWELMHVLHPGLKED